MTTPSEPAPGPSPTTAPGAGSASSASAAAGRAQYSSQRQRPRKGLLLLGLFVLGLFAVLAVWLANQSPPRVTHAEAIAMALAVEKVNELPALERLAHFEVAGEPSIDAHPHGDVSKGLAAQILFAKGKGTYTFLDMHADSGGETTLMFRCGSSDALFDYHELRLQRCDGQVKVCELWSLRAGGWMRDLLQERREILGSKELAAPATSFLQQLDVLEPEPLEAAFQQLTRSLRTSRLIGLPYLAKMSQIALPFRVAFAEFRSEHPDNLATDALLIVPGTAGVSQQEALAAFRRIQARVGDSDYLARLRALLLR